MQNPNLKWAQNQNTFDISSILRAEGTVRNSQRKSIRAEKVRLLLERGF